MNESENKGGVGEAVFGLIIIFSLFIFLLFRFGSNKDTVTTETNVDEQSKEQFLDKINTTDPNTDIYTKYIKQIYDTQNATGTAKSEEVDKIVSSYTKELLDKVVIPEQSIALKNVSDKFNPKIYGDNFEIIFENFKSKGGTSEGEILNAQIIDKGDILELSPYDKESLLRIADEYQTLAEKIQNLSTPTYSQKLAEEIAKSALNISYILRQMATEDDKKVYSLWISKYAENMFAIIADRYALHQK